MGYTGGGGGGGSGARQRRHFPDGHLRAAGARLLSERYVSRRTGRRGVWPESAAGQCDATTRAVADVRRRVPPAAVQGGRLGGEARADDGISERRVDSGQLRAGRTDGQQAAAAVQGAPRQVAAPTTRSWESIEVPGYLD